MKRNYIICLIALLATIGICSCEKQASETTYKGNVVNSLTHEAFPNLEVSVTDGEHINQTVHTDAQGFFSVLVRFDEINSQYYLLVGDSSCVPVRREFKGFGQAEVDLGIIEVEGPKMPTVTTDSVSAVTAETAVSGGNVTDDGRATVTARGVCWSKNEYPTTADAHTSNGTGKGEFQSNLTGLEFGTTYYLRAYATNRIGTAYGEQVSFTTSTGEAEVVTDSVFAITATSAKCAGNVVGDGNYPIMARGVCWSTSPTPTTTDFFSNDIGTKGPFVCALRDLDVSTTYYVRAFATNANGTMYGEQIPFTTLDGLATVTTAQATSTALTISAGGQVVNNGGFVVTERGVCYSATNTEPSISDEKVISGKGNGTFNVSITGLTAATTYYLRAYATNENGTAYGESVSVTTSNGSADVTLGTISNITALTASSSVIVTNAGGATLQSCGICWSTTPSPTTTDNKKAAGGTQLNTTYTCNMAELTPATTYYVRAYATTDVTTAYSGEKTFTTATGLPTIITSETSATSTTISSGGNVTSDGGYAITARGVCYSTTNSTPTLADQFTTAGVGIGSFSSIITNISVSTTYYVRAYATNSIGTGYGNVVVVTTENGLPKVVTTIPTLTDSIVSTGGQVTDDGGYPITDRGVCYGTLPYPDITNNYVHTNNGSGTGYYASTLILRPGSGTFYIRAYATNANGTTYGEQFSVTHPYDTLPTFTYNGNTYRVAPGPQTSKSEYITWSAANNYCENLTAYGFSDWRLPTLLELQSMYQMRANIKGWLESYTSSSNTPCYSVYWSSEISTNTTSCTAHYVVKWSDGTTFKACDLDSDGKWWHEVTPHYFYIAHFRPIRIEE